MYGGGEKKEEKGARVSHLYAIFCVGREPSCAEFGGWIANLPASMGVVKEREAKQHSCSSHYVL